MEVAGAIALGLAAGLLAGLLGVGGGILLVPTLTLVLGLDQVGAEATSLLAMAPVAVAGAVRQRRHGNVDAREGLIVGVLAVGGTAAGVALSNTLPDRALRALFAALILLVAAQIVRRSLQARGSARA